MMDKFPSYIHKPTLPKRSGIPLLVTRTSTAVETHNAMCNRRTLPSQHLHTKSPRRSPMPRRMRRQSARHMRPCGVERRERNESHLSYVLVSSTSRHGCHVQAQGEKRRLHPKLTKAVRDKKPHRSTTQEVESEPQDGGFLRPG